MTYDPTSEDNIRVKEVVYEKDRQERELNRRAEARSLNEERFEKRFMRNYAGLTVVGCKHMNGFVRISLRNGETGEIKTMDITPVSRKRSKKNEVKSVEGELE